LTWHGELLNLPSLFVSQEYVQSTMDDVVHDDRLEDMIRDVRVESFAEAHGYRSMSTDERFHRILDQLTSHGCRQC